MEPFNVEFVAFGSSVTDPTPKRRQRDTFTAVGSVSMVYHPESQLLCVTDGEHKAFYPVTNIKQMKMADTGAKKKAK